MPELPDWTYLERCALGEPEAVAEHEAMKARLQPKLESLRKQIEAARQSFARPRPLVLPPPMDFAALQNRMTQTSPIPTPPVAPTSRRKHVDPRMLKMLSENPVEALDWTSADWASKLGCSESAVRKSKTWKKHLPSVRAHAVVDGKRRSKVPEVTGKRGR